jgi:Pyridoxamine 5'-phosphate oxidase
MIWAEFEAAAPEVARLGKERFDRSRVALLGTLRKDGSPRISPVEPHFVEGHLLFGAMTWSLKARDLLSDMRCVLHSAVTAPDAGESELKLYGRAREVRDQRLRGAAARPGGQRVRPSSACLFHGYRAGGAR